MISGAEAIAVLACYLDIGWVPSRKLICKRKDRCFHGVSKTVFVRSRRKLNIRARNTKFIRLVWTKINPSSRWVRYAGRLIAKQLRGTAKTDRYRVSGLVG